jgi:signal transduction histidine kinase
MATQGDTRVLLVRGTGDGPQGAHDGDPAGLFDTPLLAVAPEPASQPREPPKPLAVRTGALASLLGAIALVGWHLRVEPLYEVGGRTMHENSALCFLLVGAAIAFLGQGHRVFALIVGAYGVVMGVGSLAAPARMDSLVSFYDQGSHPQTPMGAAVALCWALLGAGLIAAALSPVRRRALTPLLLVSLASLVGALAVVGGFRFLASLPRGSNLASFATMPVNTTLGLLVLAVALGSIARPLRPGWAVLPAGVAMFAVVLIVWQVVVDLWGAERGTMLRTERADTAILVVGVVAATLLSVALRQARRAAMARQRTEEALDQVERASADRERVQVALEEAVANLKRTNTELAHFAYVATHDLAEPLARLEAAMAPGGDTGAHAEVRELQVLVRNLSHYTEVLHDGGPAVRIDLGRLVVGALARQDDLVRATRATVDIDQMPVVTVDPMQVGHLLEQLLVNAITFVPDDRRPFVRIAARRDGEDAWRVMVTDNGFGIDPAFRQEVFRLFRRLPNAMDRPGTGVGLAVCERIVGHHGGRIWVEDGPGGEGSRVCFTLPDQGLSYTAPSRG